MNPSKRDYADVCQLTLLYGGQGFQLVRFAEVATARLGEPSPRLKKVYEVYTTHQLGLAERILYAFTHAHRDDFGCAMAINPDVHSRPSLLRLYHRMGLQNPAQWNEKLLTHVRRRLDGEMTPHVILWVQQGQGRNVDPSDGILVLADCETHHFATKAPVEGQPQDSEKEIFRPLKLFKLSSLQSVDFPEDSSTMILGFPDEYLHLTFHDDAARQMWRLALRETFIRAMDASGNFRAVQLPGTRNAKMVYATKLL